VDSEKKPLRKILYAAMHYDYGRPAQGTSFEYNNFLLTLRRIVPSVVEFDFMTVMQEQGRERMNRLLMETAIAENPDLVFCILFTEEILGETIAFLSRQFVTFNWFCDDHWRFRSFSRHFAPFFTYVSTTDPSALAKYAGIGYNQALLTQWGANHYDYRRLPGVAKTYDVTFVGQPHGSRRRTAAYLWHNGVGLQTYGQGWKNGRITQEEMIRVFNASRINLNLSNSSWNIHSLFRGRQQIKGRNFEIPGCGGFLLTNAIEGLDRFYIPGKEVAVFSGKRDLLRKIKYYLEHEQERETIARNGYERTIREHTYERRLRDLFTRMGFVP
jgi:spore maturation protein CgeB